jgi:hypothetical protein
MKTEELVKKVMDRSKDLQKFDLINLVCKSYSKGEFGDDLEVLAPTVLAFIGGILMDDASKARKALSTMKTEKFLSGLSPYELEKYGKGKIHGGK